MTDSMNLNSVDQAQSVLIDPAEIEKSSKKRQIPFVFNPRKNTGYTQKETAFAFETPDPWKFVIFNLAPSAILYKFTSLDGSAPLLHFNKPSTGSIRASTSGSGVALQIDCSLFPDVPPQSLKLVIHEKTPEPSLVLEYAIHLTSVHPSLSQSGSPSSSTSNASSFLPSISSPSSSLSPFGLPSSSSPESDSTPWYKVQPINEMKLDVSSRRKERHLSDLTAPTVLLPTVLGLFCLAMIVPHSTSFSDAIWLWIAFFFGMATMKLHQKLLDFIQSKKKNLSKKL